MENVLVLLLLLVLYADRISLSTSPRPWEPSARQYSREARELAGQPVCAAVGRTVFHPDESNGIYPSYLWEHFRDRDFDPGVWGENYWTVTQPPIMRYLIGIGRNLGGYGQYALTNSWRYELSCEANVARGAMPDAKLLWWSRLPMAVLAAVSFFILFGILRAGFGRPAAYAALLLVVSNPYIQDSVCRAMTEAPLVFSLMLAMAVTLRALSAWERGAIGRSLAWVAFAGAVIGWGAAAKLNAIVGVAAVAGLCGLAAFRRPPECSHGSASRAISPPWRERAQYIIAAGAIVGVVALAVFIGVNPYLYRDTAGRITRTLKNRVEEMTSQMNVMPDRAISGARQRAEVLKDRLFERFSPFRFRGAAWINIPLSLAGLIYLAVCAWRWLSGTESRAGPGVVGAVLLAFAVVVAGPTLLTPIDWDRYFLLPVLFCTVFTAVALTLPLKRLRTLSPGR
ncbi:MAG: glycosyltransferase family 39 protein [bacterium]